MAVILNNIEMPNDCAVCPFSIPWDSTSSICKWEPYRSAVTYEVIRPEWCPLEPKENTMSMDANDDIRKAKHDAKKSNNLEKKEEIIKEILCRAFSKRGA